MFSKVSNLHDFKPLRPSFVKAQPFVSKLDTPDCPWCSSCKFCKKNSYTLFEYNRELVRTIECT